MPPPKLDIQCQRIFGLMLVGQIYGENRLRFNKLQKMIQTAGAKMAKPTLILHLNHLMKLGLIIRKEEGKQKVTYGIDTEKWKELIRETDTWKKALRQLAYLKEDKAKLEAMSLDEMTTYVGNVTNLKTIYLQKFDLLDIIHPEDKFKHSLQALYISKYYEIFYSWWLSAVEKRKDEWDEAMRNLEHNVEKFKDILFEPRNTCK